VFRVKVGVPQLTSAAFRLYGMGQITETIMAGWNLTLSLRTGRNHSRSNTPERQKDWSGHVHGRRCTSARAVRVECILFPLFCSPSSAQAVLPCTGATAAQPPGKLEYRFLLSEPAAGALH
jgi:hypothetical protein